MDRPLTEKDHLILDAVGKILDGLADYLGGSYEFVLHSLENYDKSVVKIINGYHTGRKVGSPITNLALSMLERINEKGNGGFATYFSKNRYGEPLKASTIAIRGENDRIIGLLCMNYYLNTPLISVLENLMMDTWAGAEKALPAFRDEYLAENTAEMIAKAVEKAHAEVESDTSIPATLKKKHVVALLHKQGVFKVKDSVNIIADLLRISRNTVYLHLRSARKDGSKDACQC